MRIEAVITSSCVRTCAVLGLQQEPLEQGDSLPSWRKSCPRRMPGRARRGGVRFSRRARPFQVAIGMQKYIYHRPAHGEGVEGHQPPYIALGDFTMLKEGMTISNEPGLYDPENGFGYNHSDCVLVTAKGGVPMTKEWCFLKL